MKKLFFFFWIGLLPLLCLAQDQGQEAPRKDTIPYAIPPDTFIMRDLYIDSIDITPQAIETDGWLLMNEDIKNELSGAVDNMYNFKFERAEKQFRSLRRRYKKHPMPYFLMGLSYWWKIVPTNVQTKQFDAPFFAYMDSTIYFAEQLYEKDAKNLEAAFFLSAAYGFQARLHSERSNWRKATICSRHSLEFLQKSRVANGLSPEFLFGEALYNYYAVWIAQNYPLLKPVILFFPRGNKELGLQQLKMVARNGFYTGTEAKFFLMKILANEENDHFEAMPIARNLANTYPDNAYFQRFYAMMNFREGNFRETERLSNEILTKYNKHMPGYEAIGGRYASYYLAYICQNRKDFPKAKQLYDQCIRFARQTGEVESGYYVSSHLNLARIFVQEKDLVRAKEHYEEVKDKAERKTDAFREARDFLRKNRKV
ncbi:tol-pal system protein YbgF [Adhaeribacter arboris]|uniref:Tol-pal system protein YbgF n=1 Tax=Adhaeribacter arboris TaxID=2072846 RepID=A0A2T2Y978_9BACT|nr:tetratricopeptide repeat protein [Adhaeribacter arboris]PSR52070.1 tol-pal system protein YbgF [Adhaeribacter arboris]